MVTQWFDFGPWANNVAKYYIVIALLVITHTQLTQSVDVLMGRGRTPACSGVGPRAVPITHPLMLGIPHTKPHSKFEVPTSSNFGDMFDRMPKIVGVTWPRSRPFSGQIYLCPLDIPRIKPHTKFEVSSSSSFGDIDATMVDMTLNDL